MSIDHLGQSNESTDPSGSHDSHGRLLQSSLCDVGASRGQSVPTPEMPLTDLRVYAANVKDKGNRREPNKMRQEERLSNIQRLSIRTPLALSFAVSKLRGRHMKGDLEKNVSEPRGSILCVCKEAEGRRMAEDARAGSFVLLPTSR